MALSLDVSSADVAYKEDLDKTAPATQIPSGKEDVSCWLRPQKSKRTLFALENYNVFCETWIHDLSPR